MQIHHTGYRIRGFYRVAHSGHVWGMTSKHAQHRLAILKFSDRHGKIAASEAFKVSIRTLYRWRQTLKHNAGNVVALTPESCSPITVLSSWAISSNAFISSVLSTGGLTPDHPT